eukprot:jgi/Chlat1/4673/Chrsp3S05638
MPEIIAEVLRNRGDLDMPELFISVMLLLAIGEAGDGTAGEEDRQSAVGTVRADVYVRIGIQHLKLR